MAGKSTTFKLSADSNQFVGEVGKATKAVNTYDGAAGKAKKTSGELTSAVADGAKTMVGLATAAAAAGAAMTAALVKSGLQSVDALAKTADKLGVSTQALASLRHAAELTGVETGKFDVALQRMTRRLADAASGSGPAVDAFKALGLSASELIKLSPDQALSRIADQMNKVENQSQKVSLAFKLFDSEGVGLVNTLALGSEGLAAMAQEAELAGIALTRIDAAKVEAANDAMFRVQQQVTGLGQQLAVQFAPVIEGIAARLFGVGKEAGGMAEVAGRAFEFIIKAASKVADPIHGLRVVWIGLRNVVAEVINLYIQFVTIGARAADFMAKFTGLTDNTIARAAAGITEFADSFKATVAGFRDDLAAAAMEPLPSVAIGQFVADSKRQFEAQAIAVVDSQKTVRDEIISTEDVIEKTSKKITKTTKKTTDEFAKSWENATERIDESFANAWKGAFDSFDSFADSILDSFKDLLAEMAHQAITKPILVNLGLSGSGTSGSGGFLSSITGASGGSGGGFNFGSIFSGIGSLFTGGSGAAGASGGGFLSGIGSSVGSALSNGGWVALVVEGLRRHAEDIDNGLYTWGDVAGGGWFDTKYRDELNDKLPGFGGGLGSLILPEPGDFLSNNIAVLTGGLSKIDFSGDGKRRSQVGVSTDPNAGLKYVQGEIATAESGLSLAAINLGTKGKGVQSALDLQEAFLAIDSILLDTFRTLTDKTVDFTGDLIGTPFRNEDGSRNKETQYDGFIGAAGLRGISGADLAGAPDTFVRQWIEAANAELSTAIDFEPVFAVAMEGELLADTLLRVHSEFVAVNTVLNEIGITVFDLTGKGMALADGLVQAFGGLDNLLVSAESFYNNFYTAADQFEAISAQVVEQFDSMNMAIPESREAFKNLVDGISITTDAGQKQFAALLQLSPLMNEYYNNLVNQTGAVEDLGDAIDDFLDRIIDSINRTINDIELPGADADKRRREDAQAFIKSQIQAGEITDQDELDKSLGILREDSADLFGSFVDYQRDIIRTRNDLKTLKNVLLGDVPEFETGGVHSGGFRVVGEAGPELEFTGPSRIVSNSDVKSMMSNEDLLREIRELRADVRSTGTAVAKNTLKSHKLLQKWDIDGMPADATLVQWDTEGLPPERP